MQHLWEGVYGFYTGRKPKTGEGRALPPKKLVLFKCGQELNDRVDYKEMKT
jgi:nucleoid DNA-binding protein